MINLKNIEEIKKIILRKYPEKYPEKNIGLILQKIENMDPTVRSNLELFLSGTQPEPLEIQDYSVERLVGERGMNEIAAYLTLDWLVREPEKALESLNKGQDFVSR